MLEQSGEVLAEGEVLAPVYQCEHCTRWVDLFGVNVEVAYTFCVDASGHVFDPSE
jgi:hypothetical protein